MQEVREEQARRKAEGKTAKYKALKKRKHGCSNDTDIAAEKDRKKSKNSEVGCSSSTEITAEEDKKTYEQ